MTIFEQKGPQVGIRWTIGNVSDAGFEALRLSVRSAFNLFGSSAKYTVCVNNVRPADAASRTGELPPEVQWLDASELVPSWLRAQVDDAMAEGVAWKLAPVRVYPTLHELSLDNDVILWTIPEAMQEWLQSEDGDACLLAADMLPALGQFADMCGGRVLNSGIRGVKPGFDLESRLRDMLRECGVTLRSELDEQGLQAAVLSRANLFVVPTEDVSICSPMPIHQQHLGRCGAHFVGLNQKWMPWTMDGRGLHELIHERWRGYATELAQLVGSTEDGA